MEDIIVPESEKELDEEGVGKKSEESSNGFITNIITNLVSHPVSPKAGDYSSQRKNGDDGIIRNEDYLGRNSCGVMNNLISNLLHQSEGHHGTQQTERSEKKEDENGKLGGFIDNIVSHFPTTIPDDAVPTTDEASILIHSIVKD